MHRSPRLTAVVVKVATVAAAVFAAGAPHKFW